MVKRANTHEDSKNEMGAKGGGVCKKSLHILKPRKLSIRKLEYLRHLASYYPSWQLELACKRVNAKSLETATRRQGWLIELYYDHLLWLECERWGVSYLWKKVPRRVLLEEIRKSKKREARAVGTKSIDY